MFASIAWNSTTGIGCWSFILLVTIMSSNVIIGIACVLVIESSSINVNGEDGLVGSLDVGDGRSWIQALGVVDLNGIDELGRELLMIHLRWMRIS